MIQRSIVNVTGWLQYAMFEVKLTKLQLAIVYVAFIGLVVLWAFFAVPLMADAGPWAYATAFAINLVSNASVFVPIPGNAAVVAMAGVLDPLWLGLISGIGAALGEIPAYWVGLRGRQLVENKRFYGFIERQMEKRGGIILLFVGLNPLIPSDIGAVLGGSTRYPFYKFMIFMGTGKIIMSIAIMYLASLAIDRFRPVLDMFT